MDPELYLYDALGQLESAIGANGATEDLGYDYDAAWNLSTRTNNLVEETFTVNADNELTNSGFAYDANGNMTSTPNLSYTYDDENQLIRVDGSGWYSEFDYDGRDRRRVRREYEWDSQYQQWSLIKHVRYVYDGNRVIQERNGSNQPQVTYTRGRDMSGSLEGAGGIGGLLARSTSSGDAFYHADGNGNITAMTDGTQSVVATYRSDPYGNILSQAGALVDDNLYRFSSKEWHQRSGLVYYLYRYYSPYLQRWLNRDPIGIIGGVNEYVFVSNSPTFYIDPLGLIEGKVACDGKGGWADFYPSREQFGQKCLEEHENQHLKDFKKKFPDACKGREKGYWPPLPKEDVCKSECEAYKKSEECFEKMCDDPNLTPEEKHEANMHMHGSRIGQSRWCSTECKDRPSETKPVDPGWIMKP